VDCTKRFTLYLGIKTRLSRKGFLLFRGTKGAGPFIWGKDEVLCIETGYEDAETCGIFVTLLVTQGFSGKDSGGGICGVKSRDEGDEDCDAGDEKAVDKARCKRNVVDGVDLGGEANDLVMSG
jgi:hypothetical protein